MSLLRSIKFENSPKINNDINKKGEIHPKIPICPSACQPMILPIKLAACVRYISVKFHEFSKPVTLLKYMMHNLHEAQYLTEKYFNITSYYGVISGCY